MRKLAINRRDMNASHWVVALTYDGPSTGDRGREETERLLSENSAHRRPTWRSK